MAAIASKAETPQASIRAEVLASRKLSDYSPTMTTIATCANITEAQMIRIMLEEAQIKAYLPEEITGNATPQFLFGSGVRVQVSNEDADEARQFLAALKSSKTTEA